VQLAAKFGIVLLIALAFTAIPGGGGTLNLLVTLLTIVFFTVLAFFAYRLYRQYSFELDSLTDQQRFVLYSSVGLAVLTICATGRLFSGIGVLVWLALLGLCSFGIYWVWNEYRQTA
jgi:hypothetical protein